MPSNTDQSISIAISATGRMLFGFINTGFVLSLLGALQMLALVMNLLVTCLLGVSCSFYSSKIAVIGGFTFYVIVFLVSFWCLLTTGFIYISSACSLTTATLLPKTVFFLLYNAMAALFYLVCSITCLGEASSYSYLTYNNYDVRSTVIGAAVLGIVAGAAYVIITIVSVFMYRKGTVSSPS